ncbi:MAG: DNA-processing protein DprA [Chloroflexota bacterium]
MVGAGPTGIGNRGRADDHDRASERDAWAVLASVTGLGPVGLATLLDRYGSGRAVLAEATAPGGPDRIALAERIPGIDGGRGRLPIGTEVAASIAEAAAGAASILERIAAADLRVVTLEEPAYPRRLAAIEFPPHVLFVRGSSEALDPSAAVALVGTRRPTAHGRLVASRIALALVRAGATVVSGLAVGIDGAAHAAAAAEGGPTIAVIGGGHGRLYPAIHARLAAEIVAKGGAVVSELPPDTEPTRGTFPRRNRVISGLTDATIVVEAPAKSGALLTASWALEQGRECFLVPGNLGERASEGCLAFLRDYPGSARIVAGIPQLLDDLGLIDHRRLREPAQASLGEATLVEVGGTAAAVGRGLLSGATTVDELVALTGHPVATVLGALTILEARGLAVGVYGRYRATGSLAGVDVTARRVRSRGDRLPASSGRC